MYVKVSCHTYHVTQMRCMSCLLHMCHPLESGCYVSHDSFIYVTRPLHMCRPVGGFCLVPPYRALSKICRALLRNTLKHIHIRKWIYTLNSTHTRVWIYVWRGLYIYIVINIYIYIYIYCFFCERSTDINIHIHVHPNTVMNKRVALDEQQHIASNNI